MNADIRTEAVFLDALGTLVQLEPPWIGLRRALGDEVPEDRLVMAVRAEMAYYRDHSHEGRDAESLAKLRESAAQVLSQNLGFEVPADVLVDAIRFDPFPDAPGALTELRGKGVKLVCVSNWDISLPDVLDRCGLAGFFDGFATSAEAGALKPDPAVFRLALDVAGVDAAHALHVGDTPEEDIAGAEAAGVRALLIDRDGAGDIASLSEIAAHV